jgi:predicted porin
MNLHAFAILLGGLILAAAAVPAAGQNTIYGQVRLTLNSTKAAPAGEQTEMRDNASRLGIRGAEDLGGGMAALFGMEMGIDADTGAATVPAYRNSYVGLRGDWGAVALGRLDSANPTGSPLYSQVTAITSFAANDAGATAIGTSMLNARNRTSNAVGYASPNLSGFDVRARYYLRGAVATPDVEDGSKSLDLGLNYAGGPLKAGIGFGKDTRPSGLLANEFSGKWQAGMRYDFGAIEPYVLAGQDKYQNTALTRRYVNYWIAGAKYSQGAHAVVLNLLRRDVQASPAGIRNRRQLAYTYALSRRTELQAFYDRDGVDSSKAGAAIRSVGAGIRHDF